MNKPNPLRHLREQINPNRSDFVRRYRLGYGSVFQAEIGLIQRPVRYASTLADIAKIDPEKLLADYDAWREENGA